jgi:hypothetical protein
MKLYFENSRGQRRVIAEPHSEEEAWKEIHRFCEDRKFKIYYVRECQTPDGARCYDVGSHTEFFYLYNN